MAQSVTSGAFSYANYGYETTDGTVAASFPKCFGPDLKVSFRQKQNMERVYGIGARNAQANVAKKLEIDFTADFQLSANSSWLRGVLGAIPTDAGVGPYTHTFAESNSLTSFSIGGGIELGTSDIVAALIGCKINKCTIGCNVDEIAKVRLEGPARAITMAATGIGSVVAPTEQPLHFAYGAISVGGTAVGYIQSCELTIGNNVETVYGLGSRYAQAAVPKGRAYDLKITAATSDPSLLLEKFYGDTFPIAASDLATTNPAGVAFVLTFDNGGATTASRKVVITLANAYFDTHDMTLDLNEILKEDLSGWALSCTSIVVTNNTATDVAAP
jgi:hypothetical protein